VSSTNFALHVLVRRELDRPLLTGEGIEQISIALSGRITAT
jgi:hypothetical protein